MTPTRILNFVVLAALSLFLGACGGGHKTPTTTPTTFTASSFTGAQAFSATGSDPADGDYFVAGSITADGKGGITGIEDLNLGSGVDSNVPLSGTYTVDRAGNVSVTLSDGTGIPTFFTFSLVGGPANQKISYNGTGSGSLQTQSTNGFSNVGTFAFTLSGEGEGTVSGSGSFTTGAGGAIGTGTEKYQDGSYVRNVAALSGMVSPAFDGGRGSAVIGSNIFSYYVVSPTQIILAGLESSTLLSGTATKQ
jgi:hypothetical protein